MSDLNSCPSRYYADIRKAFEPFRVALEKNETDTLGRLSKDAEVLFVLSGSWTGSADVTLGDLRKLANAVRSAADDVAKTKLAIGTRIRFLMTLSDGPDDHSPGCLYARKGQLGEVTGHNDFEGHMVKADDWPAAFGAVYGTEFVVCSEPRSTTVSA